MALRQLVIFLALVGGAFAACTRVETTNAPHNVPLGDGGFAGEPHGGSGFVAGQSGDASGGARVETGGAPSSIELGVWPTFEPDPQESSDVQAVLASVSALSVGAMTLPLAQRWDDLSGATGSPRAVTWQRLDAMTQPFRDRGGNVALCIDIVDREQPAWPVMGDLDVDAASSAIESTIDEVYRRYAAQLSHLCFGYELDRYLAQASSSARKRLLQLVGHAVDYASGHPARVPGRTSIGAAITLTALAGASEASLDELLLGDEVVAVYDPLGDAAALKPPASITDELNAALDTLEAAPGPRLPLTLFEVGYPSSADAGSSEKAQRTFYDALFDAIDTRRDDVSFVGVFGLGDRAAADCEAEAALFGGSIDAQAERALVRCSMGLRAENADKLAWPSVLAAVSRYR